MIEIGAALRVTMSAAQAKQVLGSSLADGIDFRVPDFPIFVERVQGLSANETWGRWSDGQHVLLELKHTLSGRFRLLVRAVGYGPNIGVPVSVTIGRQTRTVKLPAQIDPDDELTLDFDLREPDNIIEITVPHPIQPPGAARMVGIGFFNLRMESATLAGNRHRSGVDMTAALSSQMKRAIGDSTSVRAAKNAVCACAKLLYKGAKPFIRPIASRARR